MDSCEEVRHSFAGSRRRDQEEGGGAAGPSTEPRRDQDKGGGALGSESWTTRHSFAAASLVVPQQQCYGHCVCH